MESARPVQAAPHVFRPDSRHWVALVALAGLGFAAAAAFTSLPLPPCPFRVMTHLPCPGCGMTRSVAALLHGNLALSFRYHPLGAPLVLGALGCLALPLVPVDTARKLARRAPRQQTIALIAFVLLIAVWLVRVVLYFCGSGYFLW
jgi:hypothetical protein